MGNFYTAIHSLRRVEGLKVEGLLPASLKDCHPERVMCHRTCGHSPIPLRTERAENLNAPTN
jgi:hypothetical protein